MIKWLIISIFGLNFHNKHFLFYIPYKIYEHSFISIDFIESVYWLFDNPYTCWILHSSVHDMLYALLICTLLICLYMLYISEICTLYAVCSTDLFITCSMLHWFVHSIWYASLVCTFHNIPYCILHWSVHSILYVSLICSLHAVCFTDLFMTCCMFHWSVHYMLFAALVHILHLNASLICTLHGYMPHWALHAVCFTTSLFTSSLWPSSVATCTFPSVTSPKTSPCLAVTCSLRDICRRTTMCCGVRPQRDQIWGARKQMTTGRNGS